MTYRLKSSTAAQIRAGVSTRITWVSEPLRPTPETDAPNSWGSVEPKLRPTDLNNKKFQLGEVTSTRDVIETRPWEKGRGHGRLPRRQIQTLGERKEGSKEARKESAADTQEEE